MFVVFANVSLEHERPLLNSQKLHSNIHLNASSRYADKAHPWKSTNRRISRCETKSRPT